MTKKKEPHELKKRGRKETVHDNADLRSHLAGVQHLNQLTDKAQKVIRTIVKNRSAANNSNKAYDTKDILWLITAMGNISLDKVKRTIDESPRFDQCDYSDSSVKEYKRVITEVSQGLGELLASGEPVRTDDPHGDEYFTGGEVYELRKMLDKGMKKEDFLEAVKKFCQS
ncbi:hypothetical protein FEI17_09230 [Kosakonia radicincitans]|uniref:hypothetical protein n=2 Tax=Kosakonia TaxID=1330547 RepID=UPI0011EF80BD|nr:hypothetical protein [Kosakonia radicincitans]QEM90819.1 hypothetical protein FEI17_09230 [Kosakonia radicincitans]